MTWKSGNTPQGAQLHSQNTHDIFWTPCAGLGPSTIVSCVKSVVLKALLLQASKSIQTLTEQQLLYWLSSGWLHSLK